nr:hypothetical protein [Tanacetum cinerariifolium]
MRDKIKEHVWYIGNGRKVSLSYDKWHGVGPLCNFITKRDIYDARMKDTCRVVVAVDGNNWKWPAECYSNEIWGKLQTMIKWKSPLNWKDTITEFAQIKCNNNIWSILRRLVFGAVVYYIWQERNARVFRKDKRNIEVLFKEIVEFIKMKLMNLKVKDSKEVKRVELI